jgi:hypothetical protein
VRLSFPLRAARRAASFALAAVVFAAATAALLPLASPASDVTAPQAAARPGEVTKSSPVRARTFTIRYRNAGDVALLVQPLLSGAGSYTLQPALKTLTVQDTEAVLARVADVVRSFDVPPRNVEVTINLLVGSREGKPGAPSQNLSRELRGITDVLPDITKWTNYRLIDSVSITASEGAATTRTLGAGGAAGAWRIEMGIQSVDDEHGVIRIEPFVVRKEVTEAGAARWKQEYASKLNLRPGRLLTVVAARSEKSENALFLTIRARVLE